MDAGQDREEWRRERSLRALGHAVRGEDVPPSRSLLSIAGTGSVRDPMDARARHGLARERRQAEIERAVPGAAPDPWSEPWDNGDDPRGPAVFDAGEEAPWVATGPDSRPDAGPRRRWPSWRLAAATTALGACIGAATALSLPPRYQATAALTFGGEGDRQAAGAAASRLRVLTSGMVLTRVVDRLNLTDDPEFNGKDGRAGLAGLLHAVLMRGDAAADDGQRQALAVDHLAASLSVVPADAGIVAVTATTGNGEKSALIANAVADVFIEVHDRNRPGAVTGDAGAADARAADAAPLAPAERRLGEFAVAHGLGDLANEPDRIAEILNLDQDLANARSRTETLNARVKALRSVGVEAAAAGLPQEFETGTIEALRAQYLDLRQQADSAAVRLGPRNPQLRSIRAQLAGAQGRLSDELRRVVAVQQAALKQAVETEQGYAARLAKSGLTGEDIATLRDLQGEVAAAAVDRQTVTASVPATTSDAAGQGAHVVSRAEVPAWPSGPSRTLLTLAGSILGLFAGLGLGVLRGGAGGMAEGDAEFPATGEARPPQPEDGAPWLAEPPAALPFDPSASFDPVLIPYPMETAMYPAYSDPSHPQARQPQGQPQGLQPVDYPPQPPMQPYMQPAPQHYLPAYPPQPPYPQAWQPAPPYPYPQPVSAYAGQPYPPQPAYPYPPQDMAPRQAIDNDALDEIRASLHEFREALRELAENRSRRRIF